MSDADRILKKIEKALEQDMGRAFGSKIAREILAGRGHVAKPGGQNEAPKSDAPGQAGSKMDCDTLLPGSHPTPPTDVKWSSPSERWSDEHEQMRRIFFERTANRLAVKYGFVTGISVGANALMVLLDSDEPHFYCLFEIRWAWKYNDDGTSREVLVFEIPNFDKGPFSFMEAEGATPCDVIAEFKKVLKMASGRDHETGM